MRPNNCLSFSFFRFFERTFALQRLGPQFTVWLNVLLVKSGNSKLELKRASQSNNSPELVAILSTVPGNKPSPNKQAVYLKRAAHCPFIDTIKVTVHSKHRTTKVKDWFLKAACISKGMLPRSPYCYCNAIFAFWTGRGGWKSWSGGPYLQHSAVNGRQDCIIRYEKGQLCNKTEDELEFWKEMGLW